MAVKRGWEKLAAEQKKVIDNGFSSGNALICGGREGVFFENYEGAVRAGDDAPVTENTIFHLYSMTKIFTVTAALMLAEQGKIDIDAPVSRYIEEYARATVYKDGKVLPATETMTVRMLFTMTSGLTYLIDDESGGAAALAERWRSDLREGRHWDNLKFARELAAVPLEFEPGERFRYGLSHDVLGAIIELVSGVSLDRFFEDNIFRPLGMNRTFFRQKLPPELESRLADNTSFEDGWFVRIPLPPKPVPIPLFEGIDDEAILSGGAGLVGTARDYGLFLAEFLRPGNRLLSPESVVFLTSAKLSVPQRAFYNVPGSDNSIFGPEHSFAFGVRVQDKPAASGSGSVGEWGWSGALGTWFFVSPRDDVWFVYMHQHTPANHDTYIAGLRNTFYDILKKAEQGTETGFSTAERGTETGFSGFSTGNGVQRHDSGC